MKVGTIKKTHCSLISGPNLQHVKFTFKWMGDSNQAFLSALLAMALIDLPHTRRGATLRRQRNTMANDAQIHCTCLAKGLRLFTTWNIHSNIRLFFFSNFTKEFSQYVCCTSCMTQHAGEKENGIAINPQLMVPTEMFGHSAQENKNAWEKVSDAHRLPLFRCELRSAAHKAAGWRHKTRIAFTPLLFRALRRLAPGCSCERQS